MSIFKGGEDHPGGPRWNGCGDVTVAALLAIVGLVLRLVSVL